MEKPSPDRGRLSWGVICLNVLTGFLVVLDLPFALLAPTMIGMTEAAAGGPVLWAELLGILMMYYPLLAIGCVIWSVMQARAHRGNEALLFAVLPFFIAAPAFVLMVLHCN